MIHHRHARFPNIHCRTHPLPRLNQQEVQKGPDIPVA